MIFIGGARAVKMTRKQSTRCYFFQTLSKSVTGTLPHGTGDVWLHQFRKVDIKKSTSNRHVLYIKRILQGIVRVKKMQTTQYTEQNFVWHIWCRKRYKLNPCWRLVNPQAERPSLQPDEPDVIRVLHWRHLSRYMLYSVQR